MKTVVINNPYFYVNESRDWDKTKK